MRALLLFGIVLFSGTYCIRADSEEKKVHWTEINKDPFSSISDRKSLNNGADYNFIDEDDISKVILPTGRTGWHSKNTKVDWSETYVPKLTKVVKGEGEKRTSHAIVKIILKIVGAIILVLICGCLYACARCLCRKKNQQVASNAGETVPALPPNPNIRGTQEYPQQPVSYPLPQMPNLSAPYTYSLLQQNPHNPAVPYTTACYSTPSYPAEPYPAASYPAAPYPTAPYPTAPYPTAPYPRAPYPTASYPTGPVSSPPAPTNQEKEANNQV